MTDDEARALAISAAEQLQGSSRSIESLGAEFEHAQDNAAFCAELDQLVFCCARCDWWFEQSDMSENADDEWFCISCGDE